MISRDYISNYFSKLQQQICAGLEKADGKAIFNADHWERTDGGGGVTRIIQNGAIIEKGGVAYSKVYGPITKNMQVHFDVPEDTQFFATGVSLVIHPSSPYVPIVHMNVRYFELSDGQSWFGGGIDLTPIYIDVDQAFSFHKSLKNICDEYHPLFYMKFKNWADDYFYLKHRSESRGVGGIFFDHLTPGCFGQSKDQLFHFVKAVGENFIPIYTKIMYENKGKTYGFKQKNWQALRRGRYVEFNLIYDRGTRFGLDSGGRTESILMSLPTTASWLYDFKVEPHSPEAETTELLQQKNDWINMQKLECV